MYIRIQSCWFSLYDPLLDQLGFYKTFFLVIKLDRIVYCFYTTNFILGLINLRIWGKIERKKGNKADYLNEW